MGFSSQEYWSGLPCPPPGDLSYPGIEPGDRIFPTQGSNLHVLCLLPWQEGSLPLSATLVVLGKFSEPLFTY